MLLAAVALVEDPHSQPTRARHRAASRDLDGPQSQGLLALVWGLNAAGVVGELSGAAAEKEGDYFCKDGNSYLIVPSFISTWRLAAGALAGALELAFASSH